MTTRTRLDQATPVAVREKVTPMHEETRRLRKLRLRLHALRRHAEARDPETGKSRLAVEAGRASGRQREGSALWGLSMAAKRWYGLQIETPFPDGKDALTSTAQTSAGGKDGAA